MSEQPAPVDTARQPPPHGPRRARIAFTDSAAKQLEDVTGEAAIHALDRALVVVAYIEV
ncbi:hypothetical protein GCM10010302_43420 [Streptomyces polychromogenes]|uniref:Uncharacterized protein n=1 Tax=Streptomyces polychromogenes TaxID=67342 RepID=A0ABP3F6U8_9ACTN